MASIYRMLYGQVTQSAIDAYSADIRGTGAMANDNEVIKLKYLRLELDADKLFDAYDDVQVVDLRLTLSSGVFSVGRIALRKTDTAIEAVKEWFFPDDFPLFVSDEAVFSIDTETAEGAVLMGMSYFLVYEIVKVSELLIVQANEGYVIKG